MQEHQKNHIYQIPFKQQYIKTIYPEYSHQLLLQLLQDPIFNYGLGSIIGSCMGDTLGSYCQFQNNLKDHIMDQVMQMRGGGTFPIKPGQLTDDSQLAQHLITALKTYDKTKKINQQTNHILLQAAIGYEQWLTSNPFDVGKTCSSAFKCIINAKLNQIDKKTTQLQLKATLQQVLDNIQSKNSNSQSNGSLMRIAPMGFFTALVQQQFEQCSSLVLKQIHLTHSHQNAVYSAYYWVKLLRRLIRRKQKIGSLKGVLQETKKQSTFLLNDWIKQSQQKQLMKATQNMGWAKIAWTMGLNRLNYFIQNTNNETQLNEQSYKTHIRKVIQKGGDTDTNAAIVGGLIGAVIGFKQLPKQYLKKMMILQFPQKRTKNTQRPKFYEPRRMLIDVIKLYRKMKK